MNVRPREVSCLFLALTSFQSQTHLNVCVTSCILVCMYLCMLHKNYKFTYFTSTASHVLESVSYTCSTLTNQDFPGGVGQNLVWMNSRLKFHDIIACQLFQHAWSRQKRLPQLPWLRPVNLNSQFVFGN